MAKYAENTHVDVTKTKYQIEAVLAQHGASGFGYMSDREHNRSLPAELAGPLEQALATRCARPRRDHH